MYKLLKKYFLVIALIVLVMQNSNAQQTITEGTLTYDIVINSTSANTKLADLLDGAQSIVYIKGNNSRSDFITSLGRQTTIIDGNTKNVYLLKEYGDSKFLITMTSQNWQTSNAKYDNEQYKLLPDTKTISGYKCNKALITLKDGSTLNVYYTPELKLANYDFLSINNKLPGLILEYESTMGGTNVIFSMAKIKLDPVPVSKFDIPKSGYRVMTYEESLNISGDRK